jgi:hypothetical protein
MIELEFRNVDFFGGVEPENLEKNPWSKGENQQQTQLTYDVETGNHVKFPAQGTSSGVKYPCPRG